MTGWQRRSASVLMVGCLALASGSLGCAMGEFTPGDPMKRRFTLTKMQKRYSHLIRFGKFQEASLFVHPEQRKDFLDWAPDDKKIKFTDYQIGDIDVDEEKRNSTIEVTYTAYSLFALVEYEMKETQKWNREGKGNNWVVTTSFVPPPPEKETDEEGDEDAEESIAETASR